MMTRMERYRSVIDDANQTFFMNLEQLSKHLASWRKKGLKPTILGPAPQYVPPLRTQVASGLATAGKSLSDYPDTSFDASGDTADILAQYGYDRLDRLDYAREQGLDAKATSVLESISSIQSTTMADTVKSADDDSSSSDDSNDK